MSAFILGTDHIDYLVSAAIDLGTNGRYGVYWQQPGEYPRDRVCLENANALGAMLMQENVNSIRYRYPDWHDLPDPSAYEYERFRFSYYHDHEHIAQVCKAVACYEYQSCEHPEWKDSEAKRVCDAIVKGYIARLPGYEDAQWEVTREER